MLHPSNANFRVACIGECEYPPESFDLITSMDTMYFAKDMTRFVAQIKSWLKPDGILFVGYQEGDVIPRTQNVQSAALSKALHANRMPFQVIDITRQTYDLLIRKRQAALDHQAAFEKERLSEWFDLLMLQTECICKPYELFEKEMARYLYIARKK